MSIDKSGLKASKLFFQINLNHAYSFSAAAVKFDALNVHLIASGQI